MRPKCRPILQSYCRLNLESIFSSKFTKELKCALNSQKDGQNHIYRATTGGLEDYQQPFFKTNLSTNYRHFDTLSTDFINFYNFRIFGPGTRQPTLLKTLMSRILNPNVIRIILIFFGSFSNNSRLTPRKSTFLGHGRLVRVINVSL